MERQTPKSFSLFELNEHLKRVVEFNMRTVIWINCEIADVNTSRGHVYLSLVERSDYEIKARAEGVIWLKRIDKLNKKLGDSLWSILQIGRQILVAVQAEYHEYYGMKLSIKDIDPSVTIGQLELKRNQVLKKLISEQFTELNKRVPTRLVWQRIAVVSSANAAGLQDFQQQLKKNPHGYQFSYQLFEAAVQGGQVTKDVIHAIEEIEQSTTKFDCIVIVRGGGAKLDLMGFDDYDLCVAIATAELPVLVGIGHDIDETLADLVAYHSLKTPTAVADFLIHRALSFESRIHQYGIDLQNYLTEQIQQEKARIELLEQRLKVAASLCLDRAKQKLAIIEQQVKLLDPQKVLERGFSLVTTEEGKLIKKKEELHTGETYTLTLADGKVKIKTVD